MDSQKKTKSKTNRCFFCNKKLKMIQFSCKCGQNFCITHLNPHSHQCTFNSKEEKQKEIQKNNPKLSSKFQKI